MPTLIGHIAVPIVGRIAVRDRAVPRALLVLGMLLAVLPDADVVGLPLGVPYESAFGYRGISHSLVFALCVSALTALAYSRATGRAFRAAWLFLLCCAASHPLLDALTNGGLALALLWPFTDTRYFSPWRPISVSPIGLRAFVGERGLRVLGSELVWVWAPCVSVALLVGLARTRRAP